MYVLIFKVISDTAMAHLKDVFMDAFDENEDNKIEISEVELRQPLIRVLVYIWFLILCEMRWDGGQLNKHAWSRIVLLVFCRPHDFDRDRQLKRNTLVLKVYMLSRQMRDIMKTPERWRTSRDLCCKVPSPHSPFVMMSHGIVQRHYNVIWHQN